ncbi:repressor LexA, partial [Candidatus Kuenenbacteria bacterium CG10_big_fil_rev_8_21_14_0_10_36_11]
MSSVATVHQHIGILKIKGFLKKQPRGIEIKNEKLIQIPLIGTISAGQPIEALEEKETVAVLDSKLPKNGKVFALRVAGQSMIDENINNGDIILVKQQVTAENGQKVVALIDNSEATLKRFYKEKGHIRLQPANKIMNSLIIQKNTPFAIQGIV